MPKRCDICDNSYHGEPMKNARLQHSTGSWISTVHVCPACAVHNPGVYRPDSHHAADYGDLWEG